VLAPFDISGPVDCGGGLFSVTAVTDESDKQPTLRKRSFAVNDDLEEERTGILRRLRDNAFGRRESTEDEDRRDVHRIGTINRRLRDEEDD